MSPRTNRLAKVWGLADNRILKFSEMPSSIPGTKMQSLLRLSALDLFPSPPPRQATSATTNLAQRSKAVIVLDGPDIATDPFAYPLSWSTKNCLAVTFGACVYYQNLDTRKTVRLWATPEDWLDELHSIQWAGIAQPDLLALGTTSGRVSLCDAGAPQKTMTWPQDLWGGVGGIDWLDHVFAVGRGSGRISLFDCRVKEGVKTLSGHKAKVLGVRWGHNGNYLASGDKDGTVSVWDARADKILVGGSRKGKKMKHKGPVKVL